MIVIPAIDLKNGQCVRLYQGAMDLDTVYSDDPGGTAAGWQEQGAERIHVVDLNGAFEGHPVNLEAIRLILDAVTVPIQLGGGIRSLATIEQYLDMGVRTVILGSVAARDPQLVREACRAFPGRVSVGIDARDNRVAVQGWAETTDLTVLELARRFEGVGVAEIIHTDISRDGALTGPNLTATRRLAEHITVPVILSGGVAGLDNIREALAHAGPFPNGGRISGVIIGKALYDGRIDFAEAVRLTRG
ncbi:MAG: 1-(5-phosphoribosyl)-5-[(5-phosphoribosylamino)methylideneamino]imidazole-4-carboxamide isomerase [Magnetococcales bacterium]|nr:1-(5-phosphoribosyl)-5-[(5-phosphoribosylamino)methylideneamino]imidazole-4-carboxamide isomerase [Magnetococcales bacterium]